MVSICNGRILEYVLVSFISPMSRWEARCNASTDHHLRLTISPQDDVTYSTAIHRLTQNYVQKRFKKVKSKCFWWRWWWWCWWYGVLNITYFRQCTSSLKLFLRQVSETASFSMLWCKKIRKGCQRLRLSLSKGSSWVNLSPLLFTTKPDLVSEILCFTELSSW
jgi:hypothetical protein